MYATHIDTLSVCVCQCLCIFSLHTKIPSYSKKYLKKNFRKTSIKKILKMIKCCLRVNIWKSFQMKKKNCVCDIICFCHLIWMTNGNEFNIWDVWVNVRMKFQGEKKQAKKSRERKKRWRNMWLNFFVASHVSIYQMIR